MAPLYVGSTPVSLPGNPVMPDASAFNRAYINAQPSATAHTKGAWYQILASTPHDANLSILSLNTSVSGTNTATLVDVAVGESGSEVPILSDLAVGGLGVYAQIPIPAFIPAGSRIAVRYQTVLTTARNILTNWGSIKDYPIIGSAQALEVIGSNTATSDAVPLSSNAWVEVTAATPKAYRHVIVIPSLASSSVVATNNDVLLGSGTAGSEVQIAKADAGATSNEALNPGNAGWPSMPWLFTAISGPVAAGTRLSAKRVGGAGPTSVCVIGVV